MVSSRPARKGGGKKPAKRNSADASQPRVTDFFGSQGKSVPKKAEKTAEIIESDGDEAELDENKVKDTPESGHAEFGASTSRVRAGTASVNRKNAEKSQVLVAASDDEAEFEDRATRKRRASSDSSEGEEPAKSRRSTRAGRKVTGYYEEPAEFKAVEEFARRQEVDDSDSESEVRQGAALKGSKKPRKRIKRDAKDSDEVDGDKEGDRDGEKDTGVCLVAETDDEASQSELKAFLSSRPSGAVPQPSSKHIEHVALNNDSPDHISNSIDSISTTSRAASLELKPDSPNPPEPADPISNDDLILLDPESPLYSTPPTRADPTAPISPPITPRKPPQTASWTSSLNSRKSKQLASIFNSPFIPKSNRPVFRMLHARRREHHAGLPPNYESNDPLLFKIRCYDRAITSLSELEAEEIVLRDSGHGRQLKKQGKLAGWGDSMLRHLDQVRKEEEEVWKRDGKVDDVAVDATEIAGTAYEAELEREAEQELATAAQATPEGFGPLPSHQIQSTTRLEEPSALAARIPGLDPSVARDLVQLGYSTVDSLRRHLMMAPKNPDGSVNLRTHPKLVPKGILQATIPAPAATWVRFLPQLEKSRGRSVMLDIAARIAEGIATVLGVAVTLDGSGARPEGVQPGPGEKPVRIAVVGALRCGEVEAKELQLIVESSQDPRETLDTILDHLEDSGVVLATLFVTKGGSAECVVSASGSDEEGMEVEEAEIEGGQLDEDAEMVDGPMMTEPATLLKLSVVGSPQAFAQSVVWHSTPKSAAMSFQAKARNKGYAFNKAEGVFKNARGDVMPGDTEERVLEFLNIERGTIFKAGAV